MTQKEKIQQEIEQTLETLNGVKRAESNPYLFTRIKARMNRKAGAWDRTFSFVNKPLVALAVLALVMAMNGWSYFGSASAATETVVENETANLPDFENDYKLITSTDSYDLENANANNE